VGELLVCNYFSLLSYLSTLHLLFAQSYSSSILLRLEMNNPTREREMDESVAGVITCVFIVIVEFWNRSPDCDWDCRIPDVLRSVMLSMLVWAWIFLSCSFFFFFPYSR
jgi:hypothetical protein